MPGSEENMSIYVPMSCSGWSGSAYTSIGRFGLLWSYDLSDTPRTNSGLTYFQLAQIGFPGPIHEALSVLFSKEAQVGNKSCSKQNVAT